MGIIDFSAFVKQRMNELQLTPKQVATKISLSGLYKILGNGVLDVRLKTLLALAATLKVSPVILMRLLDSGVAFRPKGVPRPKTNSDFVVDITFPDDEMVPVGSQFEKIWEIQNTGSDIWEKFWLVCVNEQIVLTHKIGDYSKTVGVEGLIPLKDKVPVPITLPGQSTRLSVWLQAPSSPCVAVSYWKMIDEKGTLIFPEKAGIWCKVRVV